MRCCVFLVVSIVGGLALSVAMGSEGDQNEKREVRREFFGDVISWLISRTPLPEGEEARRAAEAHEEIKKQSKLSPVPQPAKEVLNRLVRELPQRMRPPGFHYSLTVLDEPGREAFTVGAGRIYVPQNTLKALLADGERGGDRLAFVLAHEMGHICRRHTRRGYQLAWLHEQLKGRVNHKAESERVRKLMERSIDATAKRMTFLYSDQQEYKADLFAIHLCRNAAFDVETCLDPLRKRIAAANPQGLSSAKAPADSTEDFDARRLKRLRAELDGVVANGTYGLLAYELATGQTVKIQPRSIPQGERVLIFVHGLESDVQIFGPLAEHLAKQQPMRMLAFRHPNDGSVARSGKLLQNEMKRVGLSPEMADFVCHSAGGLVFRWYAEVEGGLFHSALLMGTPHAGSDLVKLRTLLEAKQFLGDLGLGFNYNKALEQAILDSKGAMGFDLEPESLLLRYLNRPRGGGMAFGALCLKVCSHRIHAVLARLVPMNWGTTSHFQDALLNDALVAKP